MARPNPAADWSRLMFDASRLWADASMVVALRTWKMMAGGRFASPEAAARKTISLYGRKVRANRKRLG
jgi:hypothetical protein